MSTNERRDEADRWRRRRLGRTARLGRQSTATTLQTVRTHHCHTHTRPFNDPLSGTTRVSRYQKVEPIWILLKQETVSGSGISWAICKSTPRSRQITMPAPHHTVFYGLDALPTAQSAASRKKGPLNGCLCVLLCLLCFFNVSSSSSLI